MRCLSCMDATVPFSITFITFYVFLFTFPRLVLRWERVVGWLFGCLNADVDVDDLYRGWLYGVNEERTME